MARKMTRAARRRNSIKPPVAAELAYVRLLLSRTQEYEKAVDRTLGPVLERFVAERSQPGIARSDALLPEYVLVALQALETSLGAIFQSTSLNRGIGTVARRTDRKNKEQVRRILGIDLREDFGLGDVLDAFRDGNVRKVRTLMGSELQLLTELLAQFEGQSVRGLRKAIQERLDVTRSRASLLARDQVLTLNAQITRTRMQNVGVTQYIWTTSGDEKVRKGHRELDGTVQSWSAPPNVGGGRTAHPGEDPQCRCTAAPVLAELQ